nr:TonB-dependent receptor [Sphingomonas sp.]
GAAFSLSGQSQFDGFDPATFARADTLDSSRNRLSAGRLWISGGDSDEGLSGTIAASLLGSSNRNLLDGEQINRTRGNRRNATGQIAYRFATGAIRHAALLALEHEREEFHARDTVFGGFSNQDRQRSRQAITGEWRAELAPVIVDLALRKDVFSAFKDATTLRASALVALGSGLSLAGSYAEGIAQPTFFDLFGFFPGSFVGNPELGPESSRGVEASLRYRRGALHAALTGYRQRLGDEIVDMFDPATFLSSTVNRDGRSRRSGIEAELGWSPGERLRLTAYYAFLDSDEPGRAPATQLREVRRPRHSGSVAADGTSGRLTYGASLAHAGARLDTNFDVFPARRVRLKPYWLASGRLAYSVGPGLELFVRGSNLFDARYQDVFGYRTEGRALYAGVSLRADRRSSP